MYTSIPRNFVNLRINIIPQYHFVYGSMFKIDTYTAPKSFFPKHFCAKLFNLCHTKHEIASPFSLTSEISFGGATVSSLWPKTDGVALP